MKVVVVSIGKSSMMEMGKAESFNRKSFHHGTLLSSSSSSSATVCVRVEVVDCEMARAVGVDGGCNWLAVRMQHDVDLGEKAMDSATREASATAAAAADRLLLAIVLLFSLLM